jgi:NAD-specific glutamate dehydrogenase
MITEGLSMKWKEPAATSLYQTAVAVKQALQEGDVHEAVLGLEELIDALSRADQRALEHHLIRLMQHIIKWKTQPERHSRSWVATINNAREAIREIQEDTPSLTDDRIRQRWDACLRKAHREAEGEIDRDIPQTGLSWAEVFEAPYTLEAD